MVVDAQGQEVAQQRYYPFGGVRWSEGTLPTDRQFTGQRLEAGLGLYDYKARYYDPGIGRFVQPDTVVPRPGNPQSLNRYSYVDDNPLRYTDPTGMFSEEEIEKYLGVKTWEEVLAMFGKEGKYAGLWGWLEVLHHAHLGDIVSFGMSTSSGLEREVFRGQFYEDEDGQLRLRSKGNTYTPLTVLKQTEHEKFSLYRRVRQGMAPVYAVEEVGSWAAGKQYLHLKVDWNKALNPVELVDMAKVVSAPFITAGLTGFFFTTGVGLCGTGIGCVAGSELAIAGGGSAAVSSWLLTKAAVLYLERYWSEVTKYEP